MRRAWRIRLLALALSVSPGLATAQTSDDSGWLDGPAAAPAHDPVDADPRALSEFRPILDKYGDWVEDARYGLVWVPAQRWVGDDFAPYLTRGRWALDTAGDWVWVSDYPFGGVVFHYGRWVWVVGLGWAWVPGYRYAPAWVSWRVPSHDGLYVGWAPMPPSYIWVGGMAAGVGFYVVTPWVFCPSYYVFSPHLHSHHVHDPSRMKEAARQTKPYHPQVGARGPSPSAVGVPRSRVPARVPAKPRPSDTLRRHSALPESASAEWLHRADGPTPVVAPGRARGATPVLPARERTGVGTQPRASKPPARTASGGAGAAVLRPPSLAPRMLPSGTQGTRYRQVVPQQGHAVLPRATVAPRSVVPPRAPVRSVPAPSRSPR